MSVKSFFCGDALANKLILTSAIYAANSKRADLIYKPRFDEFEESLMVDYSDIDKLISDILNDVKLPEKVEKFIIFTLSTKSCYTIEYDILGIKYGDKIHKLEEYKIISDVSIRAEFEAKRKKLGSMFLFHGSPIENWYSIMTNGIQNMSNTKCMLNGAAYGEGVYLSNKLNVSMTYGSSRRCRTKYFVVGVFEVLGKPQDHAKGAGVFVVKNIEQLLLRYIIVVDHIHGSNIVEQLSSELFDRFVIEKKRREDETLKLINKRDYRLEQERIQCSRLGYSIKTISTDTEYDCIIWVLHTVENKRIQVLFPSNYPIDPPIIWDRFGAKKIRGWTPIKRINKLLDGCMPMDNMSDKTPKDFFEAIPKVRLGDRS